MPAHDLRTVVTRLQVRARGTHRKGDWIEAICQGWQVADQAASWLAALSPAAQAALYRLSLSDVPLPLFVGTFGELHTHQRAPRRAKPAFTASDELYYHGLLYCRQPTAAGEVAQVMMPADWKAALPQYRLSHLQCEWLATEAPAAVITDTAPFDLVHDVGQLLIYLHQQHYQRPHLTLQHGRWLSPRHLVALNQRLLQPEAEPLPRSHKQCDRLRLLAFLAEAAGLIECGVVTAIGWAWLAQPTVAQGHQLWAGWQAASPALRESYVMPDQQLPAPWPLPMVAALAACGSHLTPPLITAALLQQTTVAPLYWVAHFADLQAMDGVATALLQGPLHQLGIVAVRPSVADLQTNGMAGDLSLAPAVDWAPMHVRQSRAERHLALTAWGAYLLYGGTPPSAPAPSPARLLVQPQQLVVQVPAICLADDAQSVLASYAQTETGSLSATGHHQYRLDADTVAQAAASGLGLPQLWAALARLGLTLPPACHTQLTAWWQQGRAVQVGLYPLLRTDTPTRLAELTQDARLRSFIGEVLTPTLALLQGEMTPATAALRRAGWPVVWPGPTPPSMDDGEMPESSAIASMADLPHEQGVLVEQAQGRALWLAGQLYRLLGEHLVLPLPPPMPALATLYAQLPVAEQALLQAQLADVQERLLALLDHLALTPPPSPSEPMQWQPLIDQAIAQQQRLALHYFSAGRNLLTRRLIEPYWVAEQYGALYLTAYCHQAGRVLTFRLDRIQALAVCPDTVKG